jgi:hypothetical protein
VEADLQLLRFREQRPRLGAGHLAFVEGIDLGLVGERPARKERRQGELGIDDQIAPHPVRLAHQLDQAAHDPGSVLMTGDRPELRTADRDETRHLPLRTGLRSRAA